MSNGTVTISIDLELAWGNWDNLAKHHIHHCTHSERPIVARLVDLFDRYDVPATWAFVAALLDEKSHESMPGDTEIWYAPDVIETIRSARTAHEFGSHGGRHRYFDEMASDEASQDIAFAREIHQRHGLPFKSFVFPRNKVAKTELLHDHGLNVFRGEDVAWHQRLRGRNQTLGRIANLVDKILPVAPQTVNAQTAGNMVDVPGSMLFLGRDGVRKLAMPGVLLSKLKKGVDLAGANGGIFHLWFHPSNFWHESETQFEVFEQFLSYVHQLTTRDAIKIKTMAEFA